MDENMVVNPNEMIDGFEYNHLFTYLMGPYFEWKAKGCPHDGVTYVANEESFTYSVFDNSIGKKFSFVKQVTLDNPIYPIDITKQLIPSGDDNAIYITQHIRDIFHCYVAQDALADFMDVFCTQVANKLTAKFIQERDKFFAYKKDQFDFCLRDIRVTPKNISIPFNKPNKVDAPIADLEITVWISMKEITPKDVGL